VTRAERRIKKVESMWMMNAEDDELASSKRALRF
jgi:hypothetical protein